MYKLVGAEAGVSQSFVATTQQCFAGNVHYTTCCNKYFLLAQNEVTQNEICGASSGLC